MRTKIAFILVFLSIFIGSAVLPQSAAAAGIASERIAVSLVIDTSGSMAETDPSNLRKTAADIFVDMLSPEDHVGIVSFATDATEVAPMQQVGDSANKQSIKDTLASISKVDGNTNYRAALEKAEEQLGSIGDPAVRKVILFLTDGVPEPDYALREDTAFMTAYMDSVWQTTARLGLKNIAVYTLGFGTVDTSILQRIATDTRGEAKFLGSAGDIAVNFFEVLRTLKNRQGFWNESLALAGETVVPFEIDAYTSQVTMAVAYDAAGTDVSVRSVGGMEPNGRINIQKNEQYSIVTMNQTDKELAGDWELVITGTGNAQLFGDKDLTLKSWMISPQANTQVPVEEPIAFSVEVTGELTEGMAVQVVISKNGGADLETVPLKLKDGIYQGTYDNVDQGGSYILESQILDGDTVLTNNSTTISVQQLPILISDQEYSGTIFKVGENQNVTSHLEMDGLPLDGSTGITVNSMNLVTTFPDGREEILPMQDGGPETSADEAAGDGNYTTALPLAEEGAYSATIVVQGTTPEGNFTVQKEIGSYEVAPVGEISGRLMDSINYETPGGNLSVPVQLKNDSKRSETVFLSVESDTVAAEEISMTLKPGETTEANLELSIDADAALGEETVSIRLAAEDPLTAVQPSLDADIQLLSAAALSRKKMQDFLLENMLLITAAAILPLLALAVGRLIYALKVKRALRIIRSLIFSKIGEAEKEQEWFLPKKADQQVIAFGKPDDKAALSLEGAKIPYQMLVTVEKPHARFKWLEGYRALSEAYLPVRIKIETTPPGIFKMNGEVYTDKEIFDKDCFESGGYRFVYKAEKTVPEENKAKNVLEGKM